MGNDEGTRDMPESLTGKELYNFMDMMNRAYRSWDLVAYYTIAKHPETSTMALNMASEMQEASNFIFDVWAEG